MSGVPILEELRPRAFAMAYRMLGSVSEAEDIVQEALLRLHLTLQQGERIESPRAYLSTVVTRLCIDQLRRLGSDARATSANGCPSRWSTTAATTRPTTPR
jgi:DNA-directed RNA polymerase specialized sigma24 family protein